MEGFESESGAISVITNCKSLFSVIFADLIFDVNRALFPVMGSRASNGSRGMFLSVRDIDTRSHTYMRAVSVIAMT